MSSQHYELFGSDSEDEGADDAPASEPEPPRSAPPDEPSEGEDVDEDDLFGSASDDGDQGGAGASQPQAEPELAPPLRFELPELPKPPDDAEVRPLHS